MARCPYASEACAQPQVLDEIGPNHFVACHMCSGKLKTEEKTDTEEQTTNG
jgi:uncharacterized Zn-finger protein